MQRSWHKIVGPCLASLATALAMALSGCGQKGPLTLPASAPAAAPPAHSHAPDAQR
ncbi:MAG: LPS translocon maturation chaperone LptM [Tepidimonas sp.]|uniref:LPS translocon maturation chaperone LptM n=1 Tax=Tepidimonas sp. TaxID=2002775 RepID=UPI004054F634